MQRDDFFQEHRLGAHDVLNRLAWHRIGAEANEVARMTGIHGDADFAVCLKAADARAVSGARIHDNEWTLFCVNHHTFRRNDADQTVVDGLRKISAVQHEFRFKTQHVGH